MSDWIFTLNPYTSSSTHSTPYRNTYPAYRMPPLTMDQDSVTITRTVLEAIKIEPPERNYFRNGYEEFSNAYYKELSTDPPSMPQIGTESWSESTPDVCYGLLSSDDFPTIKQEYDYETLQPAMESYQSEALNYAEMNNLHRSCLNPGGFDNDSNNSVEELFERAGLDQLILTSSDELLESTELDDLLAITADDLSQMEVVKKDISIREVNSSAFSRKHYRCPHCTYNTNGKGRLTEHIEKIHSDSTYYRCNSRYRRSSHRNEVEKENIEVCETQYYMSESNTTSLDCPHCSYYTYQTDRLQKHILNTHPRQYHAQDNSPVPTPRSNKHRNETDSSNMRSKRKSGKSSASKPHKCPQCSYSAHRNDRLQKHIAKIHSKNVCYKCNQCSFESTYNRDYYEHMKTHYRGPPFRCEVCSYKSKLITAYIAHRVTHTGDRLFNCTLCAFSCKRKYHLKGHMISHSKEKNFLCPHCSKKYSYKCSLVRHLKTSCKAKNAKY